MSNPTRLLHGKYDVECEAIQRAAQAQGVILAVIHGNRGSGFSVTATPELHEKLPNFLRIMADKIEEEQRKAAGN